MVGETLFVLLAVLLLALLIAAVVYVIVAQTRRRREFAQVDPGIGTVRRLYLYVVSFVALMMAANGVVQIADFVLEGLFGGEVLVSSRRGLALGLSLTVVGLPLWLLHWRIIVRHVRELPVETRSLARKLYIYVVLGVALGFVVAGSVGLLQWIFGAKPFSVSEFPLAALVVWGGVWAFYWRLETEEGQPTAETRVVSRLYVYVVAVATLIMGAVGLGQAIHIVLLDAYESLTSVSVLARSGLWRESMKEALALALTGGAVWAVHWLRFARPDSEPLLRQLYLYGFAILGSILTVLTALGIMLYGVLVWTIGVPDEASAAAHFRFLPGVLASLIVGGGILAYHWLVAKQESEVPVLQPWGVRRSYPYVLAALGLGTLAVGIVTLVNVAVGLLVESGRTVLTGGDLWQKTMSLGLTLIVLGAPLWGYHWTQIQRRVSAGEEERTHLARRIFIFATLGAGMLALLGSVSFLIFVFFRELLDGHLSQVLPDTRLSIGIITAAAIFVPYYWMTYRTDRRVAAETGEPEVDRRPHKAVTLLVNEGGTAFLRELEDILGYRVSPLQWADPDASLPELSDAELQDLARRIGDSAGPNVLLVPDGASIRVLSYS